jgi:arsenical pump membrane protein
VLLTASALDVQLGFPTFVAGAATALFVCVRDRTSPWPMLREISWGVLPLVAGLFVLVEGLDKTGLVGQLSGLLRDGAQQSVAMLSWISGTGLAFITNVMNNLPAGLIAASAAAPANLQPQAIGSLLIGVDLGPNLSVTGSLATILWLAALRREGEHVSAKDFLKVGILAMPPALLLALGALHLVQ